MIIAVLIFFVLGEDRFKNPLGWEMVGKNLLAMSIQGIVMFIFTILIQYNFFCKSRLISAKPSATEEEDVDVARERQRVYEGRAQNDLLRIWDLTKAAGLMFPPLADVPSLWAAGSVTTAGSSTPLTPTVG
ncbi:hypothetical protein ILYODFUR_027671 [Ilyodon furcidens]|uniref:Uncharacterized protein n=1 Tax=Ilyodon furcidens TaxID=33524 RepID=A0ABV0TYT1_9TELE